MWRTQRDHILKTLPLLALSVGLAFPVASFSGEANDPPRYDQKIASYKYIQLLAHALSIVQVSVKNERDKQLALYAALQGMASAVDRYSFFVPPEIVSLFIRGMSDTSVGIGLQVARSGEGDIEVISASPDGPAFKAGIRRKDLVVAIDGKQTSICPSSKPSSLSRT